MHSLLYVLLILNTYSYKFVTQHNNYKWYNFYVIKIPFRGDMKFFQVWNFMVGISKSTVNEYQSSTLYAKGISILQESCVFEIIGFKLSYSHYIDKVFIPLDDNKFDININEFVKIDEILVTKPILAAKKNIFVNKEHNNNNNHQKEDYKEFPNVITLEKTWEGKLVLSSLNLRLYNLVDFSLKLFSVSVKNKQNGLEIVYNFQYDKELVENNDTVLYEKLKSDTVFWYGYFVKDRKKVNEWFYNTLKNVYFEKNNEMNFDEIAHSYHTTDVIIIILSLAILFVLFMVVIKMKLIAKNSYEKTKE